MAKQFSNEELKKSLSAEQYHVLRESGTEVPGTGEPLYNTDNGMYVCPVCGSELFASGSKFESTVPGLIGWPSFCEAAHSDTIELRLDDSNALHRTEVVCKTCGSHLGHLFDDPASPTGKHYCINSAALKFKKLD